jgi:hypothetical protein
MRGQDSVIEPRAELKVARQPVPAQAPPEREGLRQAIATKRRVAPGPAKREQKRLLGRERACSSARQQAACQPRQRPLRPPKPERAK